MGLAVFAAAKLLKWWAIRSLGPYWTFRVIVVPGSSRVDSGPYRFLRHPNYIAVDRVEDFTRAGGLEALPERTRLELALVRSSPRVQYDVVRRIKQGALAIAFQQFLDDEWMALTPRAAAASLRAAATSSAPVAIAAASRGTKTRRLAAPAVAGALWREDGDRKRSHELPPSAAAAGALWRGGADGNASRASSFCSSRPPTICPSIIADGAVEQSPRQ